MRMIPVSEIPNSEIPCPGNPCDEEKKKRVRKVRNLVASSEGILPDESSKAKKSVVEAQKPPKAPKPKRVLTDEQKAKMKEGRERKKLQQQSEKKEAEFLES